MSHLNDVKKALSNYVSQFKSEEDLKVKIEIANSYTELKMANIDLFQDDVSLGVGKKEVWRNVTGWEGIYQISNYGNVKSMERFFIKDVAKLGFKQAVLMPEMVRAVGRHKFGYGRASFWLDEKAKHFSVHRLVALEYIPNINSYKQVGHIDNNPKNNHVSNLVWCTQKQNIQHCVDSGRWHLGEKNGNSKLNKSQVLEIRKMLSDNVGVNKIARTFNVTKCPIQSIRDGKTWRHLK